MTLDIEKLKAGIVDDTCDDKRIEHPFVQGIHAAIDHLAASYILVPRGSVPEGLAEAVKIEKDWLLDVLHQNDTLTKAERLCVEAAALLVQEGENE